MKSKSSGIGNFFSKIPSNSTEWKKPIKERPLNDKVNGSPKVAESTTINDKSKTNGNEQAKRIASLVDSDSDSENVELKTNIKPTPESKPKKRQRKENKSNERSIKKRKRIVERNDSDSDGKYVKINDISDHIILYRVLTKVFYNFNGRFYIKI